MEDFTTKQINVIILCIVYVFTMSWYFWRITKPRDWKQIKKNWEDLKNNKREDK